jgi:hypothetical protein
MTNKHFGDNRDDLLKLRLEYHPAQPPVRWADTPDDVPPWDWTRNDVPGLWGCLLYPAEKAKRLDRWEDSKSIPGLSLPRLVRDHPGHVVHPNFQTEKPRVWREVAKLWPLASKTDWQTPGSEFRNAITELVPRIGLMHADHQSVPGGETLHAWREFVMEMHFWREFPRELEAIIEMSGIDGFGDVMRKSQGWFLSEDGYSWDHPHRSEDTDRLFNLIGLAAGEGHKAKTNLEVLKAVGAYYYTQFVALIDGQLKTRNPSGKIDGAFWVWTGSRFWAWYELAQEFSAGDRRICKWHKCRDLFTPPYGNEKFCSKKCLQNHTQNAKRARKKQRLENPVTNL